jgi:hypothetical protein
MKERTEKVKAMLSEAREKAWAAAKAETNTQVLSSDL